MQTQPRQVDCPVGGLNEQISLVPALCWKCDATDSLEVPSKIGYDIRTIVTIPKPSRMTFRPAGQTVFDSSATCGMTQGRGSV
jgi:hypothetical protein